MKLSELTERQCVFCGDTFMPKLPQQVYDTADCRIRADRQARWERRQAAKLAAVEAASAAAAAN